MKKLALVVGINDYAFKALRFAIADARALSAVLEMPEYDYKVISLVEADATRSALVQTFREAAEYAPEKFLFYFAGHGVVTEFGAFLATFDTSSEEEGLELEQLSRYLEILSRNSSQVVTILDCCYAGQASPWRNSRRLMEADVSETVSTVTDTRVIIAACKADEKASEKTETGHGLFTGTLLEGLTGAAANFDGEVTVGSLHEYVIRQFASGAAGDDQHVLLRGDIGGSVILGEGLPKRLGAPLPDEQFQRRIAEGQQLLDEFDRTAGAARGRWKNAGHLESSQRLQTISRRFATMGAQAPELRNAPEFKTLTKQLENRVAQMGSIDEGTRTLRGSLAKKIGSGGFGSVWRVDEESGSISAFKIFHAADFGEKDKRLMFSRGYRAMEQLDHPHIVRVRGYSDVPVGFFMDFIDGPNGRQIPDLINEPAELLRILILTGETVQHAHGRGVIHRDIKPENILFKYDLGKWVPYLTDFDLAWFSTATSVTQKSFGNLFYASPEQLAKPNSGAARSPAVDIYAFGQLAFFLITGSDPTPFGGGQNVSVLRDRLEAWPSGDAAHQVLGWYERATAEDPALRFDGFQRVIADLSKAEVALRAPNADAGLSAAEFVSEIAFGLSGFAALLAGEKQVARSPSGRTQFEFQVNAQGQRDSQGRDLYSFDASLWLDVLEMEGVTSERAGALTLRRVNGVIAEESNVSQKSTKARGEWGVDLTFAGVSLSYRRALEVREVLAKVVDAIERL